MRAALALLLGLLLVPAMPALCDEPGPKEELGDGWQAFVAPGPIVSGHTPPVYTVEGGYIVRVPEAEDDVRMGLAVFVTLYNADKLDQLGVSAGIGFDSDQQTRYYLGGAYRFGTRAAIIGGAAVGPVPRLPAGLQEGSQWTDISTVQWGSQIKVSWFVAFTYVAWDSLSRRSE